MLSDWPKSVNKVKQIFEISQFKPFKIPVLEAILELAC